MLIDCDTCTVRGTACGDCVVTVLLGAPAAGAGDGVELDGAEQAAIAVLAGSGLVPPLRLLPAERPTAAEHPAQGRPERPGVGTSEVTGPGTGGRTAAHSVNAPSPAPRRPSRRRAAG
jgi:hypothetical protein